MVHLVVAFGNNLIAVNPYIAIARQHVDVRLRFPVGVGLAAIGIARTRCALPEIFILQQIPIISDNPRFVPNANSPTRSLFSSVWQYSQTLFADPCGHIPLESTARSRSSISWE